MERAYTVSEIDAMRSMIRQYRQMSVGSYQENELTVYVEEVLRTYIAAGADPADVSREYGAKITEIMKQQAAQQEMYQKYYAKLQADMQGARVMENLPFVALADEGLISGALRKLFG